MISVICVYNDEKVLNEYLVSSLKKQDTEYELFCLDNTTNDFKSAAAALNYGGRKATGKYVMFAHQDIALETVDWLRNAEKMLDALPDLGIGGVAGRDRQGILTLVRHGVPPETVGYRLLDRPEVVETIDECVMFIPRAVFDRLPFDAQHCDGWHLYGVDYSLTINKTGLKTYVLPLPAHHMSGGTLNKGYYRSLSRVLRKHKNDYPVIYATTGTWFTRTPVPVQRMRNYLYARLKHA